MTKLRSFTVPVFVAATIAGIVAAQARWQAQASATTERLRAVSAVDARTAWASGNRGTIVKTTDGGASWEKLPVPGAEALDFRDIEALNGQVAYALAIGAGDKSRIYKTTDGGRHWTLSFQNADPRAFYDAIAFWDAQSGIAMGDAVDGHFTVLKTRDGGRTWTLVATSGMPAALPNEGAFAASGTCLVTGPNGRAWFATGGASRARVFRTTDGGITWDVADTPLAAGVSSAGAFSIAFADTQHGMVVGGDYRKEPEASDNAAFSRDGGRTWTAGPRLRGFRSAVAFIPGTGGRAVLVAGPAGTDWSADGGTTWAAVEGDGVHAISAAPAGDAVFGVGEGGRILKLAPVPR